MSGPYRLSCHCQAVVLEVRATHPLSEMGRCDCSYCRRRGAAMIGADPADVTLLSGADALGEYRFGTQTARHFFCKTCGIYTHHQRRMEPHDIGLNVGCLEGLPARIVDQAVWFDGVTHPSDAET